ERAAPVEERPREAGVPPAERAEPLLQGGDGVARGKPDQARARLRDERLPHAVDLRGHEVRGHQVQQEDRRDEEEEREQDDGDEGDEEVGQDELRADPPEEPPQDEGREPEAPENRVDPYDEPGERRHDGDLETRDPEQHDDERAEENAPAPPFDEKGP